MYIYVCVCVCIIYSIYCMCIIYKECICVACDNAKSLQLCILILPDCIFIEIISSSIVVVVVYSSFFIYIKIA